MGASTDRAATAEKRLDAIEAALSAFPCGVGAANPLAEYLAELEAIKGALLAAKQERDEAVERCAQLEKDNEKLKYQAIHLKRAVKESDEAKAAPATS
mmetsp:Transcript_18951/g.57246  ORF Transcript_18951/g.57246 Transcript_18951/m.57246 type:complete len:98 (+) Transcript_18951:222-515(+)